ncbi:MAG: response regulator [Myxococcales bacterium]|nr:response regulator [Myxococcales bacterium]MCB9704310.1 response regulator [Myxococcales bacterium]
MAAVCHVVLADTDPAERRRLATLVDAASQELDVPVLLHEVSDGREALAAIEAHHPLLFLGEVLLPELSGLALLRRLREKWEKGAIPLFVFVTSMARESDRYWGLRNGANAYIIKPYDDEVVLARIRQVLRARGEARPDRLAPL